MTYTIQLVKTSYGTVSKNEIDLMKCRSMPDYLITKLHRMRNCFRIPSRTGNIIVTLSNEFMLDTNDAHEHLEWMTNFIFVRKVGDIPFHVHIFYKLIYERNMSPKMQ